MEKARMRDGEKDRPKGFVDSIVAGIAAAVEDIRHKVVEEPWFGRAVTPPTFPGHSSPDPLGRTLPEKSAAPWESMPSLTKVLADNPELSPEQGREHDHER
jgi:hypothetical protein